MISDYPRFLAKTSKGYSVIPQSNEKNIEGTIFALYYDDPTLDNKVYNIMQVKGSFANVLNQDVAEKFNSKEEALEFKEKAEKAGFFDLILEGNKVMYVRSIPKRYSLPVYYLNRYGFVVYTFEKKDFLISDIEDMKLAQEKKKAVYDAIEIMDYIDYINEQLKNNDGVAFVKNDIKGMFNYLNTNSNDFEIVHGLNKKSSSYVIIDKESVKKKINDEGITVIKVSNTELYYFLFGNLNGIKQKLGIDYLYIEKR